MKNILKKYRRFLLPTGIIFALSIVLGLSFFAYITYKNTDTIIKSNKNLQAENEKTAKELKDLQNQDQVKINKALAEEVKSIKSSYAKSIGLFEKIQDLKAQKTDTKSLDQLYALLIKNLSEFQYASAEGNLTTLDAGIIKLTTTTPSSGSSPANTVASNTAPASGFQTQQVKTDRGTFLISIVAADLNTTRIIVDTASENDCANNCPALPLADYVSRSGAYAGINGSFFCPPEYPSCAGKTNSFDTLLMNKNKHYFNSDNNKYSTVPLIYFSGNTMGIRGQSMEWGRETGVDGVIANHPLYVAGGKNMFGGSSDPKITSKGSRTFIGHKGTTGYIGIIYNASAEDASAVLTTLQLENALGLDQGGSTALWYNGYKAGPGRNIPNAILFVHK